GEEGAPQVAPGIGSLKQLQLTPCRQFPEGRRELAGDHRDRGPRVEQALDLVLGNRPPADDDAAAPFEVAASRVSDRHVPPPTAGCRPHSSLSWPAQRPSLPLPAWVQGQQPIES